MKQEYTLGLDELDRLCDTLPIDGIVLLRGDLAMGKTTLVKQIAKRLKITADITSPTFSIVHSYGEKLHHYDIYQDKTRGFAQKGMYENLEKSGLHVVEWGDEEFEKLLKQIGYKYTCIDIYPSNQVDKREYEVTKNA